MEGTNGYEEIDNGAVLRAREREREEEEEEKKMIFFRSAKKMKMRFLFFSLAAQKNERQHAMNMLGLGIQQVTDAKPK